MVDIWLKMFELQKMVIIGIVIIFNETTLTPTFYIIIWNAIGEGMGHWFAEIYSKNLSKFWFFFSFLEQFTNFALITTVDDYLINNTFIFFSSDQLCKIYNTYLKADSSFFYLFGVFDKGVLLLLSMFSFWPWLRGSLLHNTSNHLEKKTLFEIGMKKV